MARNGVWELRNVLLRYCATGGSSRGVREYVEDGLAQFAKKNPQIEFSTQIKSGHPCVFAEYITQYKRQRTLKNMSRKEVSATFQDLRDTLGRKVPRHNEISIGVLERKRLSVQGIWRNARDMDPDLPKLRVRRERLRQKYRMQDIVDNVGLSGLVEISQKIIAQREEERKAAMDALPKIKKVEPTE